MRRVDKLKPGSTEVTHRELPAQKAEDLPRLLLERMHELEKAFEEYTSGNTRIAMQLTNKMELVSETMRQMLEDQERHADSDKHHFDAHTKWLDDHERRIAALEAAAING